MANISTDFSTWSATPASNQPDSLDTASIQADLQALQAALKIIFPNIGAALTPTHTELNFLAGVTSAIQTQLNAKAASGANSDITSLTACTQITAASVTVATDDKILIKDTSDGDAIKKVTVQSVVDLIIPSAFASGTRMVFNQTSAPIGWTKDTTASLNDSIMRIVTGTVGSGGSTAFSTFNGQTTTGAHTLTSSEIANHTHDMSLSSAVAGTFNAGEYISSIGTNGIFASGTTGGSITVGASGGGTGHSHSLTHAIKYNDFIIAVKD